MSGIKLVASALVLSVIASLILVACEKSDPYADLNLDVEQVALDLRNNGKFVEELDRLDDDTVPYVYDLGSPQKIVVYTGSGATPEEIIVAEYDDADARAAALQKLNDHLTSQRKTFDDYNAEYRPLLDNPLLVEVGKYIIYCVSDDYDASEAVLSRYTESGS
jgi:hypothetical protein